MDAEEQSCKHAFVGTTNDEDAEGEPLRNARLVGNTDNEGWDSYVWNSQKRCHFPKYAVCIAIACSGALGVGVGGVFTAANAKQRFNSASHAYSSLTSAGPAQPNCSTACDGDFLVANPVSGATGGSSYNGMNMCTGLRSLMDKWAADTNIHADEFLNFYAETLDDYTKAWAGRDPAIQQYREKPTAISLPDPRAGGWGSFKALLDVAEPYKELLQMIKDAYPTADFIVPDGDIKSFPLRNEVHKAAVLNKTCASFLPGVALDAIEVISKGVATWAMWGKYNMATCKCDIKEYPPEKAQEFLEQAANVARDLVAPLAGAIEAYNAGAPLLQHNFHLQRIFYAELDKWAHEELAAVNSKGEPWKAAQMSPHGTEVYALNGETTLEWKELPRDFGNGYDLSQPAVWHMRGDVKCSDSYSDVAEVCP